MASPEITVLIVSDYGASGKRTWNDERECLHALAKQDIDAPVEYVLCEEQGSEGKIPADLQAILPSLRISCFPVSGSYALKNAGARQSSAPYIALLDADCRPSQNWLRVSYETMQRRPEIAAVSGRTVYEKTGLLERILCLLSRSFLDPGRSGPTEFLANNGALILRSVYEAHPLPEHLGPFAGRIQSDSILRAGHTMWFDTAIRFVHEFEGWAMERDIRRNSGYGTVATRLEESRLPYAWLVRLGPLAIPFIVAGKTCDGLMACLRCAPQYGVRWYELPAAFALCALVHWMEIPGMWSAYRRRPITETAYR